ncbi:MAG TPA: hypothetical protein VFI65_09630 [Streptosporangiaceae bacterium]|nr:hypothetical protein [Streptosporangiaceae bacterium]
MISPTVNSVIHRNCTHRHSSWLRTAAVIVAAGAAAATATAGCSSHSGQKATGSKSEVATTESKAASRALALASAESDRVKTLTANVTAHSSGASSGSLTGTVKIQLKPSTIVGTTFHVKAEKSKVVEQSEILTDKQIYFKDQAFTKATGKPWVEADISELSTKVGVSLGSLLQNLENADPLDQTKLFTASKNARVVGTTMLNGVSTTEYAGTYEPQVALAELSPKLRKVMGPTLRTIGGNPVQFEIWIDAHHVVRRTISTDNVHGQIVTTTLDVTSVNKPVRVALPELTEVAPLPKI